MHWSVGGMTHYCAKGHEFKPWMGHILYSKTMAGTIAVGKVVSYKQRTGYSASDNYLSITEIYKH